MKETRLKLLQYITGIGLLVLAGWHILFTHWIEDDVTEWKSIADRAESNGWLVFFIVLIVFGLYHGLHGLRTIILELPIPKPPVKVLDTVLIVVAIGILVYGICIPLDAR